MSSSQFTIPQGEELRIECQGREAITINVEHGSVEVNGCELLTEQVFNCSSFGVFAWDESKVVIQGKIKKYSISRYSPVPYCVDVHRKLQIERDKVFSNNERKAPRVLILGPPSCGKFTVAKTLLEYAVRCGESPLYLDFDIYSGNVTVPGCMSATVVTRETHLGTVNAQKFVLSPTVEFYGFQNCMDNHVLFKRQMQSIIETGRKRLENDEAVRHGGVIVNGGSWYREEGSTELLREMMESLQFDLVLTIQETMPSELRSRFPIISVQDFPPFNLISDTKREMVERNMAIDSYFYGVSKDKFRLANPNEVIRSMNELTIVSFKDQKEIGEANKLSPEERCGDDAWLTPSRVTINELANQILAVTDAKIIDDVRKASVLGFVFVSAINREKNTVQLLLPSGGDLPGTIMLKGDIEWNSSFDYYFFVC